MQNSVLKYRVQWLRNFFKRKKFARLPKADACAMLIPEYDDFFWPKYEALDVWMNNDSLEDCLLHLQF